MLIASSLLLLAIVSAIVAFRGWPELEASDDGAQGLIIEDVRAPLAVAEVRVNGDGRELTASAAAARAGGRDGSVVGRGDLGGRVEDGSGPGPGGGDKTGAGNGNVAPGAEGALPGVPAVPEPIPGSTDEVRNGVSNLTEGTTKGVGDTLNGVNPTLGAPLSNTGKALGEAVEQTLPKSGTQPVDGVPLMLP